MTEHTVTRLPKVGQTIDTRTGPALVEHVSPSGRCVSVVDLIGRRWELERAPHGWWTVLEDEEGMSL